MQLLGCLQWNKHSGMHHFSSVSAFQTAITRSKWQQRKLHVYPQLHRYPAFRAYGHSPSPFGQELRKALTKQTRTSGNPSHTSCIVSNIVSWDHLFVFQSDTDIYILYGKISVSSYPASLQQDLTPKQVSCKTDISEAGFVLKCLQCGTKHLAAGSAGSWQWQPRCCLPAASQTWRSEGTHLIEDSMSNIF